MKAVKTVKALIVAMLILAVVLLTTGGVLIGMSFQGYGSNGDGETIISPPQATSNVTTTQTPTPTMNFKDIKAALTDAFASQDFEILKPYLADNVLLFLYATSCCGETSDQQEIVEFINRDSLKGTTWEINPTGAQYKGLAETSNYYIVFSNNEAMAFTTIGDKITKVMFYQDYRLAGN